MIRFLDIVARLLGVLAAAALLPWLLGVPGIGGTNFARGWTIGLYAILAYVLAVFVLASVGPLARRRPAGALWHARATAAAIAGFLAAQAITWALILRGN